MGANLHAEIDLTVRATEIWRAVDDTCQPLGNIRVEAEIRVNRKTTHAVPKQEAR